MWYEELCVCGWPIAQRNQHQKRHVGDRSVGDRQGAKTPHTVHTPANIYIFKKKSKHLNLSDYDGLKSAFGLWLCGGWALCLGHTIHTFMGVFFHI